MKTASKTWMLAALLGLMLLGGCRAGFPTGKFASPEDSERRYLIFYPDGRWEGFQGGNLLTYGAYTVNGDRLSFETDSQCKDSGAPETAIYTWGYAEKILVFQPEAPDACQARAALLAGEFRPAE